MRAVQQCLFVAWASTCGGYAAGAAVRFPSDGERRMGMGMKRDALETDDQSDEAGDNRARPSAGHGQRGVAVAALTSCCGCRD